MYRRFDISYGGMAFWRLAASFHTPRQRGRSREVNEVNALEMLLFLISCLPDGLHVDWKSTNHYEIITSGEDYWWLTLSDCVRKDFDSATEEGRRLGLLFDLAEAAKAAEGQLREIADGGGGAEQ